MSKSEIAKDKQNLINVLARFDDVVAVEDVLGAHSNTIIENNSFLLQVLLEVVCRKSEVDAQKRQHLFRNMWKMVTDAQLADQHINLEALNSVRFVAASEFEKELAKESLKIQASSLQSLLPNPMINSVQKGSGICMNKYLDEFSELNRIGKGGFGTVWKAKHRIDGIIYAVKKIKFKYKSDSNYEKVMREVKSFATLNHLNVVGYNQAWFENVNSPASSSTEEDTSNSPSKESSKLSAQNCNKRCKSALSRSSISCDETSNSESFNRGTFSEKSDDGLITFRDTLSIGSYGANSRRTTKRANLNLSRKSNFYSNIKIASETSSSDSDCNSSRNYKSRSENHSKESVSRFFKLQNVEVLLYIQMEYCDGVLKDWLDERSKGNPLPFQLTVPEIFRNILNGVAYIHSKSIIHRDLKPQNIFFSAENNTMKIGDFGLATLSNSSVEQSGELSVHYSSGCGTIPYSAPEQRRKHKYDSKVDIYSLGIILIELLIDAKTRMEFMHELQQILRNKIPEKLTHDWPEYVNLVKNLVQEDPELRPSAQEILCQPPVFTSVEVEQRLEIKELKEALTKKESEIKELVAKELELKEALARKEFELTQKDKQIEELEAMLKLRTLMQSN